MKRLPTLLPILLLVPFLLSPAASAQTVVLTQTAPVIVAQTGPSPSPTPNPSPIAGNPAGYPSPIPGDPRPIVLGLVGLAVLAAFLMLVGTRGKRTRGNMTVRRMGSLRFQPVRVRRSSRTTRIQRPATVRIVRSLSVRRWRR